MPFKVRDSIQERDSEIRAHFDNHRPVVAVLLAAIDFERTARRAILALGTAPNREMREGMRRSGLDNYKTYWAAHARPTAGKTLPEVVEREVPWSQLRRAFDARNRLAHGVSATMSEVHATAHMNALLGATRAVSEFALEFGKDLTKRLSPRRAGRSASLDATSAAIASRNRSSPRSAEHSG